MKRQVSTGTTVNVTALLSLLPRRQETRLVEVLRGDSVEAVCARAFPDFQATCYAVGGGDAQPSASVRDGSPIVCWRPPEASAIIGFAAMMVTGIVVGGIVDSIFGKKTKTKYNKQTEDLSDEQYGWDYDSRNAETEGAPVPVLYGRRMVLPPVIQQHSHNRLDSGEGFAELVYAVADGGGGFSDVVDFPANDDNKVQALLDHTYWNNYNSKSMSGGDEETNMVEGSSSVYGNASFDGTTITGNSTIRSGTTSYLGDGSWNQMDCSNATFPLSDGVSNVIFRVSNCVPKKCNVYSLFSKGAAQGISGFTLYGWDGTDFTEIGRTTSYTTTGTKCLATLNISGSTRYAVYKIGGFSWKKERYYSAYGRQNITEVELWGTTATGETIPGGSCAIDVNRGGFSQTASSLTSQTWAHLNVQKKMDNEFFIFSTTPKAEPNRLNLHIEFPYGLYTIDSSGEYVANPVQIQAQYRTVASDGTTGSWTAYFNSSHRTTDIVVSGSTVTISRVSQDSIKLDFEISGLSGADHYEIQAKIANSPSITNRSQCECSWTGLDEGWSFTCNYPRTATATMKLLASETLSGQIPQFKILAERSTLNVWNSVSGQWEDKSASNPAWAAWDVIVHPVFDDREGEPTRADDEPVYTTANSGGVLLREQYDHTALAYSEFAAWAAFCDAEGITCSMYYDAQTTVETALSYLCDVGRAVIVNRGGVLGVAIDKAVDTPCYIFSHLNIVQDSWSEEYIDTTQNPTELEVTFYDRDREWERFTVMAGSSSTEDGKEPSVESVTLYACDRRDVAEAYAEWRLGRNLIKRKFQWTGDLDSMPCDIGDVVWVYGDMVRITSATYDSEHRRVFCGEEYVPERFGVPPIRVAATIEVFEDEETETVTKSFYVTCPALPTGLSNTIDWGDGGDPEEFTTGGTLTHTYSAEGEYDIVIRAYRMTVFRFSDCDAEERELHIFDLYSVVRSISVLGLMDVEDVSFMLATMYSDSEGNRELFTLPEGTAFWKAKSLEGFAFNNVNLGGLPVSFSAPRARSLAEAFYGCVYIEGAFPQHMDIGMCEDASYAFLCCVSLTGIVPASQFWGNPRISSKDGCFESCSTLSNYAEIPDGWK